MLPIKIDLPDGFLEEEVRCGYTVSREMKAVWAVELDLLEQLLRVCREHDLRIFADGGTLLGAIREHGFIAWDNDIDLVMPRDDYDRLCQIAPGAVQKPYFFQNYWTEKGYPRRHAQFRNSATTGILTNEKEREYTFNQGIFIDIFVLDGLIEDDAARSQQVKRAKRVQKFINYKSNPKSKKRILYHLCKLVPWNMLAKQMDSILKEKSFQESEYVVNYGFSFELGKFVTKREKRYYLDAPIEVPFEHLTIPVPPHYDEWLTMRYGDYMKPSKAGAVHGDVILDAEVSYRDYLKSHK